MRSERKSPQTPDQRDGAGGRLVSAKQIAHEFGLHVKALRHLLRARYGRYGTQRDRYYWIFTEAEADRVRRELRRMLCLDGEP